MILRSFGMLMSLSSHSELIWLTALLLFLTVLSCGEAQLEEVGNETHQTEQNQEVFIARVLEIRPNAGPDFIVHLRTCYLPVWRELHREGRVSDVKIFGLNRKESSAPDSRPWDYLLLVQLGHGTSARQVLHAERRFSETCSLMSAPFKVLRTEVLSSTPNSFYPASVSECEERSNDVTFLIEFTGVEDSQEALEQYRNLMMTYFGPVNGLLVREGVIFNFIALETTEVVLQEVGVHPWNQIHISGDYPEYEDKDWDALYERLFQRHYSMDLDSLFETMPEIPDYSDYSGRLIPELHVH